MTHKLEIYSRKPLIGRRQWRWRLKAANGKIIGASSESYNNYEDCEMNILLVRDGLTNAGIYLT